MAIEQQIMKHKYLAGAGVLGVLFLLYILSRSGSSSSSSGSGNILGYDAEIQQLQASSAAQSQQVNAQLQAANLQAQAANNQTIAAVQTQNYQTDAALIAALAQNQTTQQGQSLESEVENNYISSSLEASKDTNATNLSAYKSTLDYNTNIANLQYGLASQQVSAQSSINQGILSAVQAAGLNHGTSSLETQLTAIISGLEGQPGIGESAEQAYSNATVSSNQASASLWNSIASLGKSVSSGLFG